MRAWLVTLALAVAAPAREPSPQARAAYLEGLRFFEAGDYSQAVAEFRRAYDIEPAPMLLFNIGQAYRLQKDYAHAIEAYGSYLRMLPDAPNRADVEMWIVESSAHLSATPSAPLEPLRAVESPRAVVAPPPVAPLPRRHRGRAALVAGLVLTGIGLAAIGTGAYFAVRTGQDGDQLAALRAGHAAWDDHAQAVWNDGVTSAAAADALFVVGGVLAAGGGALTIVGARQRSEPVNLAAVWTCVF